MMHVDIVHRNARLIGGSDYGSREASDMWFDQLISEQRFCSDAQKSPCVTNGAIFASEHAGVQKSKSEEERNSHKLDIDNGKRSFR